MTIMSGYNPLADIRIGGDVVPMNRLGILAYGAAIVGIALLTAREVIEPSVYLYQKHTSGMIVLGVAG